MNTWHSDPQISYFHKHCNVIDYQLLMEQHKIFKT